MCYCGISGVVILIAINDIMIMRVGSRVHIRRIGGVGDSCGDPAIICSRLISIISLCIYSVCVSMYVF